MLYFLDTSALKWAYLRGKFHRRCRYILSRCNGRVFIAEISMLEIISVFGDEVHENRMTIKQFGRSDRLLFEDIADGRIEVRALHASELLGVRHLLTLVKIRNRRGLRSQDGIVAYTARRLAIEKRHAVRLLTGDRRLSKIVNELEVFSGLVDAEYLDPI
jgi:predicted nucleic acid-binding protein